MIGRKYIDKEEAAMPIEEALMAFVGIDIPKEEMEKGIPFVSFVVKEGEGQYLWNLSLFPWQTAF